MGRHRRFVLVSVLTSCIVSLEGMSLLAAAETSSSESAIDASLRQQLEETQRALRELQKQFEIQSRTTKAQIENLQRQLGDQKRIVESLKTSPSAPMAVAQPVSTPQPVAPRIEAPVSVAAVAPPEPWSPTAPIRLFGVGGAFMNISFDLLVDAGWSTEQDVPLIEPGDHDPQQRGFTIPNAEVVFDGAVDPYFKGLADVVWKLDQNGKTSVEFEEGYITTTSLPWNLQAKVGQQFVDFGRINLQHPHQWDFVDEPLIINRMFGPEGLRSAGAMLSWLMPTPFYSEVAFSALNSAGETAFSFRNTDDDLFGRPPVDRPVSSPSDLLYVPRYVASFDLTDSQTLVTGVSAAFGPNASSTNTSTQIYGGDVYWKWKPAWQSGGFPFVAWQTEALGRRYEAGTAEISVEGEPSIVLPRENLYDYGFYSQVIYGFVQRWVAGLRGEWVSGDSGAFKEDPNRAERIRFSPDITFYPTEFSKLRLQYNYDQGKLVGDQSSVWLQLEVLLGSHGAHKF